MALALLRNDALHEAPQLPGLDQQWHTDKQKGKNQSRVRWRDGVFNLGNYKLYAQFSGDHTDLYSS